MINNIKGPQCGNKFPLDRVLEHELREQIASSLKKQNEKRTEEVKKAEAARVGKELKDTVEKITEKFKRQLCVKENQMKL